MPAALVMPAGPGAAEAARLADTLASALALEPEVRWVVVVDDEPGRRLALPRRAGVEVAVVANPRNGRGGPLTGGICAGVLAGLAWVEAHAPEADFALKLDADALVIAPFARAVSGAFAGDPSLGVAGQVEGWDGTPHDPAFWAGSMRKLTRRVRAYRRPPFPGHRIELAIRGPAAAVREHVRAAIGRGYRPGDFVLASAVAVGREQLARMRALGAFDAIPAWVTAPCGDDPMLAMYAYACGLRAGPIGGSPPPLWLRHRGLPAGPEELAASGRAIVHSVKSDPRWSEDEVRAFFRARR